MPKGVKGFQKGHKFGVPRKKGEKKKNKKDDQSAYFVKYCIEGGLTRFKKSLHKLNDKQYVDAFLTLLEYHTPKLQRSELIGADKMKLQVEWVIPNKQELQGQEKLKQLTEPEIVDISPPQAKPSEEATPAIPLSSGEEVNKDNISFLNDV